VWGRFLAIVAHVTWRRFQPLGGSILLKFTMETWLDSMSFEPLIDFPVFLIQKLWPKNNKINNYLISEVITNFVVFSKSSKVPKHMDLA